MICPSTIIASSIATQGGFFGDLLRRRVVVDPSPQEIAAARKAAALAIAEQADKVLDRIWFWMGVASLPVGRFIATHFLDKLADRLDQMSDEIERQLPA